MRLGQGPARDGRPSRAVKRKAARQGLECFCFICSPSARDPPQSHRREAALPAHGRPRAAGLTPARARALIPACTCCNRVRQWVNAGGGTMTWLLSQHHVSSHICPTWSAGSSVRVTPQFFKPCPWMQQASPVIAWAAAAAGWSGRAPAWRREASPAGGRAARQGWGTRGWGWGVGEGPRL